MKLNELAADIHLRMVNDNRFGYSWGERYGATQEKWTVDGVTFNIGVGDYDCSSSGITVWKKALEAGGIKNPLAGAYNTTTATDPFLKTGLFKKIPWNQATRGDVLLNVSNHMAIYQGNGRLSEFRINEFGGVYGGLRGDQTGAEACVSALYNYPWDYALHYIGNQEAGNSKPSASVKVKFRVKQDGKWLAENKVGERGKPITGIAIDMPGWYQVYTQKYGWLEIVRAYDINDDDGYAGWNDDPILNVRAVYETPNPSQTGYLYAKYRVSPVNADYYDWQTDDEIDANQDGYAGDYKPIDRFELKVE